MNSQNIVFGRSRWRLRHADDLRRGVGVQVYAAQRRWRSRWEACSSSAATCYMAEFQVEQLCRDAKLQIYAGTDEIQVSQIGALVLTAAVADAGAREPARTARQ